jgi:2,4-diaminopentanoate dehydrogenase
MSAGARIAIVGLGLHGRRIGATLLEDGYELVGAVDVGPTVGRPLSEVLDGASTAAIAPSVEALLSTTPQVDLAVVTPAVDLYAVVEMAGALLDRGINVVTLHQDLFEYNAAWADPLDVRAKAGGASFLATGVQDSWWVHSVSIAAGSTRKIREIKALHTLDMETLSPKVAAEHGMNIPESERDAFFEEWNSYPPTHGAPLREAARRIGWTVAGMEREAVPVIADGPTRWNAQGITVPAGTMIGLLERVTISTEEGVDLIGDFRVALLAEGQTHSDRLSITGDPNIQLVHDPFHGDRITDIAVVNRLPDVLKAPPGVHFSADWPAPRYQHPVSDAALVYGDSASVPR